MDLSGIVAIYGGPGTGKTTLAASVAHRRLAQGERVLWASFYEDKPTLLSSMARLGYDLSGADVWEAVLTDPTSTFNQISHLVSHSPPNLLVLDSITQLQGVDIRANVTNLIYRAFKFAGIDAIIISEEPPGPLSYIADTSIRMSLELTSRGVPIRRMVVEKSRGAPAGVAKEFEILEGAGIIFLDELRPKVAKSSSLSLDGASVSGARSALIVGGSSGVFAAAWAERLAASGSRVLFRTYRSSLPSIKGVQVDKLMADPKAYGRHIYELVKKVEEADADVVFYDGLEVEELVYGAREAFSLNLRKIRALTERGVALVLSGLRGRWLRSVVDAVVVASGDIATISKPYSPPLTCKFSAAGGLSLSC